LVFFFNTHDGAASGNARSQQAGISSMKTYIKIFWKTKFWKKSVLLF